MNIALEVVTASFCLVSSVVAHEFGHYLALRKYARGARIDYHKGVLRTYSRTANDELHVGELKREWRDEVLWAGILGGLLPVLIYFIYSEWWPMPLGVLAVYAVGVHYDIKLLRTVQK